MNLFIDTNIFLSFFHYTSDDLEELKKLIVLVDTKRVNLILPDQVIDEFDRNRDNKINDSLKILKSQKLNLQFPQLCKDYDEYGRLRDLQKEYEKYHADLLENILNDIDHETLKADSTVRELFQNATKIDANEDIFNRAKTRMEIGNPPGKNGSLGDAIIWESLLESIPLIEDLYFVTDDKDYYSSINADKFNNYLFKEWAEKNNSDIYYYKKLSEFFKNNFSDINLSGEAEKDLLIQGLATSGTFAQTHLLISKLNRFTEFTESQVNDIIESAISNNQVYWIIDDEDIRDFIDKLISKYEDIIDESSLDQIQQYLSTETAHEVDNTDELPF